MNLFDTNNVWKAENLPDGFSFSKGVITGNPSSRGCYDLPVTVFNSLGSSSQLVRIISKFRDDVTILVNGSQAVQVRPSELAADIQNGSAQEKYNCQSTQMLIPITHPLTGETVDDVPLNFCSFRSVTLEDGSSKFGLILQFAHTLWKGLAPFGTNGFNRWKYSQLRKWLNSSGSDWFSSSYDSDSLTPHEGSYTDNNSVGFLSCLPSALASHIIPVKVITQAFFDDNNEDSSIDDPDYIDGLDADVTYDKIFIPSLSEMALSSGGNSFFPENNFEGAPWEFYSALSSDTDIANDICGSRCSVITRSALLNGTSQILYVDNSRLPSAGNVYNMDSAPAPAFVIA